LNLLLFPRLFPAIGFQIIIERRSTEDSPCAGSDKLSLRQRYSRSSPPPIASTISSPSFSFETPARATGRSHVGIPRLQHRRKPGRLLLPAFPGAGLFEAPMQADLQQGLFAVQLLLEPAQGLLDRLSSSEFNFRHIVESICNAANHGSNLRIRPNQRGHFGSCPEKLGQNSDA
jgi:hypothetical protein